MIAGPVAINNPCGAANGGICAGTMCCSEAGWCNGNPAAGTSDDHCGIGCQSAFGNCYHPPGIFFPLI